ncbi:MAG: MFS transporter [Desulfobacterales bacterium]|jgi:UMF1 family MFS transporter|nr:MFS transporter [Desulfobacterales bacterium]
MALQNRLTKTEISWIIYDVGNSAFVLIIVTTLMPIFFKDIASIGVADYVSTANWGFANSAASLTLALLAPVLGALADYQGRKKKFFIAFLAIGIVFTLLLTQVGQGEWILCIWLFILARIGWAGANIFYDAFIVDVADKDRMDRVSSHGYAWGYIGSVIPFLVIIGLLITAQNGKGDALPEFQTKVGFIIVAVWWLVFSIPMIRNVDQVYFAAASASPVTDSFRRLKDTFLKIRNHRQVFLFLAAYFFYIDGVDTVISMATAYGRDLGFSVSLLIVMILFIQIIAFPCALIYGKMAVRFSAKTMIMAGIAVYCVITFISFLLPSVENQTIKAGAFWFMSFLVGSSMGGIQALSRSYYGKLIPAESSAEFFGFYNVFGKFAAITGPFLMGMVGRLAGHSRWGVLSILILFIIGAWLLSRVEDLNEDFMDGVETSATP